MAMSDPAERAAEILQQQSWLEAWEDKAEQRKKVADIICAEYAEYEITASVEAVRHEAAAVEAAREEFAIALRGIVAELKAALEKL